MTRSKYTGLACLSITLACGGSKDSAGFQTVGRQPDVAPQMLNKELPFRYPPALFAQKVQGNVTLRIYIDRTGQIVPDSTHVAETSGFAALDSAAVKGSRELKFEPATTQGQPVPVSILLPVFFRYPGAPALPGDSVLKGRQSASSTSPVAAVAPGAVLVPKAAVVPKAPTVDSLQKAVDAITKPAVKKTMKKTAKKAAKKTTRSRTTSRRRRRR